MSHSITTENQIEPLDIDYRDPRGVIVHVTGWKRSFMVVGSVFCLMAGKI